MLKKISLTLALIFTLTLPMLVSAQGLKDAGGMLEKIGGASGEKIGVSGNLADSVATVIKTVLALVGTVFLVLTIYAGIMWMTAQGEESKVEKAMEILKAAVIGLVIIMSAYAITYFVTSRLTGLNTSSSAQPSDPSGCCYATSQTDGNCTPYPDFPKSSCDGLYQTTGIRGSWSSGACEAACPRIDL